MTATAVRNDDDDAVDDAANGTQRLDKWLWFARVIKSRTQAAGLVTDGKVRVNRLRVEKPSQSLRPGDVVTVTVREHVRVLKMVAAGARRGPAAEACTLFEDLTPPPTPVDPSRAAVSGVRQSGQGRPTKRERRQTDRLKGG